MSRLRYAVVGVELLVGVSAVYGGLSLMHDGMGMPADWLHGTPFHTWLWPGVLLHLVVAAPMFVAAFGEIGRRRWAYRASILASTILMGWILVQIALLRHYFFLQPVLFATGLLLAGLTLLAHRRSGLR